MILYRTFQPNIVQINMSIDICLSRMGMKLISTYAEWLLLCVCKMKLSCCEEYEKGFKECLMTYFGNTSGHKNGKAFKAKNIWSIGKWENVWSLLKWEIETFNHRRKFKNRDGYRFNSLSNKYNLKLNELSDYQIPEKYQNKNLDLEFNEILEKSALGRKAF